MSEKTHLGSCHCGALRFSARFDLQQGSRCNCTLCQRMGHFGAIVKPAQFQALTPLDTLGQYRPGPVGTRYFCKTCGIHAFGMGHLAELGGDFVSINLNCLEGVELSELPTVYWDGRHDNWDGGPRDRPWPMLRQAGA